MTGELYKVSVLNKKVEIKDFKSITDFSQNTILGDGYIKTGKGKEICTSIKESSEITGLFRVWGKNYITCSDYSLKLVDEDGYVSGLVPASQNPIVLELIHEGKEKIFIINKEFYSYFIDEEPLNVGSLNVDFALTHNGRLFLAKGNKLKFSKPFEYEQLWTNETTVGEIYFPESLGEVLGLSADENLHVFFKNAVYTLTALGEQAEFVLTKVNVLFSDIKKGSVKNVGNNTVAIDGNEIITFNKGKVKKVPITILSCDFSINGSPIVNGAEYGLPIRFGNNTGVIFYDLLSGEQRLDTELKAVSNDGFGIDLDKNLVKINNELGCRSVWVSIPLDFSSVERKDLIEISLVSNGNAMLTIEGEQGKRIFAINKGVNQKKLKLRSRSFVITIESADLNFKIQSIKLKYSEEN